MWERIRQRQEAFSGIFAWGSADFGIGEGRDARRVKGLWVSSDLFPALGVQAFRGRLFTAADDRRGCGPDGAVISYGFWQSHFGGDDSVIGKRLMINEKPHTVMGVTPPEFFGLSACLLAAVAGMASFVPALRAARIDPMTALRDE